MRFDIPSVGLRVCWQPPAQRSSHALGHWLPAILLLVLIVPWLLGGCGGSSSSGYADRPPSDRVAYTAWQEWTRFGRSTVVYGGQAGGYVNRNGVSERSEPLASKIGDYWGTCGQPSWNGRTSSRPWSGAFVAWTMARSGVGASDFPRDGRHGGYLASLYDRQQQRGSRAAFQLHSPTEYSPKPGDLVCTGASGPTWRHADSRTARRRIDSTANHCDIVTDVRGGFVQAIGGNVKDSVTMSLYPVDSRGRLRPTPGKTWFMVVEKRV
jgi:hypothetical protein